MEQRSLTFFLFAFNGRMTRKEYWLNYALPRYGIYLGFIFILGILAWILGLFSYFFAVSAVDGTGDAFPAPSGSQILGFVVVGLAMLAFTVFWIWSGLAGTVKRFHDNGHTGWLSLIYLVPYIGVFVLFIWNGFIKGKVGENKYGLDPNNPNAEVSDVFE
jgi:uncharacterized membrane protein YhaH (DUF805 family)